MCIINHTHQFVFVHVPKNAGTSVTSYLSSFSAYRDQEIGGTPFGQAMEPHYQERFGLTKHATADRIREVMGREAFTGYHVFATVRDPYERAISMFRFMRAWPLWRAMPEFERFVGPFSSSDDVNVFLASEFFETGGPDNIFMPQLRWLADPATGELLTDSLVRVEELPRALPELMDRLGLQGAATVGPVPRVNRGSGSAPRLDDRSREIIKARYADDFARLGFAMSDAGQRRRWPWDGSFGRGRT